MAGFFKINNSVLPTPSSCGYVLSSLQDDQSGRTQNGTAIVNEVAQKVKLSPKWSALSWKDACELAQAMKVKNSKVYLTYPDIAEGGYVTKQFYTGDFSAEYGECWRDGKEMVKDISCDFIEI